MAKRSHPRANQLTRGFILGQLHERGHTLTTARIRRLGASRATAKRDMKVIRSLVPTLPSKPLQGQRNHIPQRTLNGLTD